MRNGHPCTNPKPSLRLVPAFLVDSFLKFSKEAESEKLLIFITIYSQLLIGPVLKDKPELTVLPRGLGSIPGE